MARPRKPTSLLAITGGYDNNPGRLNASRGDEPIEQRARIAPPGVLTHADRLVVELTAVLWARFRRAGEVMPLPEFTRLQSLLGELGLTPAARSKVKAVSTKPAGRFGGIGTKPDTQK